MEFALLLHLFEDQEVLPVAEVLHAGDAVGERVGDGEFVAFAALVVAGRRNDFVDEALRRFAQDAGRFAVGVEVDGAALRGVVLPVMPAAASAAELAMAMWPSMRSRNAGWPPVTLSSSWRVGKDFLRPQSVVPIAAGEPVAGGSGFGAGLNLWRASRPGI